jgi:ATP-dependent DNA helicase RecG
MDPETPLEQIGRLDDAQKQGLRWLGLKTAGDLLYYFPAKYSDTSSLKNIQDVMAGETASVYGTVRNLKLGKSFRSKMAMASATIEDPTGSLSIAWFHQPYIAKMLQNGSIAKFTGKISQNKKGLYLTNPEFELVDSIPALGVSLFTKEDEADQNFGTIYPVYSETKGVTSRWLFHTFQKIFTSGILEKLVDPIPDGILKKYNLPSLATALVWIHAPKKTQDAEVARKRFAFEEVFMIQLRMQQERQKSAENPAFVIEKTDADIERFTSGFPFKETEAQKKAISVILDDFKSGRPMSRLLEGDVGSGKTAVAATTTYATVMTRPRGQHFGTLQVAYMCPTEILAKQHFESFIKYFFHLGISIGLITSSGCKKFPSKVDPRGYTDISRAQLLKWVANGEIPILIGTHALIQKSVSFEHLAYVIIDEQHRFGTAQRQKLVRKNDKADDAYKKKPSKSDPKRSATKKPNEGMLPHLLSMTATPIPRTLALTIYGDLDLTLLDEMPHGRKAIITEIIPPPKRSGTYEKIRAEIAAGRQAYVICPRIDEPDPSKEQAVVAKSVTEEAKRLKKEVFPEFEVDILHSKMSPKEKERTMMRFSENKFQILVATSLVEVGVNVPNATVIIIEGAERFGLAQLHQLRGRVIRSNHQAYCYVFSDTKSQKSIDRLKALQSAKNGFELAEFDLELRGSGELYGRKQWGLSDLAMEALKNIKMVEAARSEAEALIKFDPSLDSYPLLKKKIAAEAAIHFE